MRAKSWIIALMAVGAMAAQAGVTTVSHRYTFEGNADDAIGGSHGTETTTGGNLEAPQYTNEVPAGAVTGAPAQSMDVGMNKGTLKSGFTIGDILSSSEGSYSVWLKPDTLTGGDYIFLQGGFKLVFTSPTTLRAVYNGWTALADAPVAVGNWIHVALTWDDATDSMIYYVNGVEVVSVTDADLSAISPSSLGIGCYSLADTTDYLSAQYDGLIYDLQFYDTALSSNEVARLQASPGAAVIDTAAPKLAHRYAFESDVTDSHGLANGAATTAGTYTEAPLYTSDIPSGAVAGAPSQSLEVGMNSGTFKSGFRLSSPVMDATAGSYSFWFKSVDGIADIEYLIQGDFPKQFLKGSTSSGVNAGFQGTTTDGAYTTNAWNHVVVSWDNRSETGQLYINGELIDTVAYTGTVDPAWMNIGNFHLGDDDLHLANQFNGLLYDLQFYDGQLGAGDVLKLYAKPGVRISYVPPVMEHRYLFANDVTDSVGSAHGTATTSSTYLEAPQFSSDIPVGAVDGAPDHSLQVGMNLGTLKSGFNLGAVLSTSGSYSVWLKPDSLTGGNYMLTTGGFKLMAPTATSLRAIYNGWTMLADEPVAAGDWIHVVLTWNDALSTMTYYVNGERVALKSDADLSSMPGAGITVGGYSLTDDGNSLTAQFDGLLYDLQFYQAELSVHDVKSLYDNPGADVNVRPEPRLVFPTQDNGDAVVADLVVTDAPFHVDPTGAADCTEMVQAALDILGDAGGGTLYFPAGKYRFDGTLMIPRTVSVRGDWKSPLDGGSGQGTIFMVYAGRNDTNAAPFLQFDIGHNAIQNLSFWYPEQTVNNVVPYPPTILRKFHPLMLKRLTFYNAYKGLEVELDGGGGAPLVSEVYGTFLHTGIQNDMCYEYGYFDQIHISPSIWADAPSSVITNAPALAEIRNWCQANTIGLEFGRNDDIELFHITVEDAKIGILTDESPKLSQGVGAYGFMMHVDATMERRLENAFVDGMVDIDRFPETAAHDYTWPTQWKPAQSNVLINVREAPYNAAGDGVTDDRQAIQNALDAAGALGGGVVYLPAGEYVVMTNLLVPSGVELRGVLDFVYRAESGPGASPAGTALFAFHGENSLDLENESPFISLSTNSSLRGMTILYPNQNELWPTAADDPPKTYPWTIRGLGPDINVQYVSIKRGWDLIDLASHDCSGFVLQDFWTSPLNRGVVVGGGTDGGHIQRVLQSMGAWGYPGINTPNVSNWTPEMAHRWNWTNIQDWFLGNCVGYVFGDVKNVQSYGAMTFAFKHHMQFVEEAGNGPENMDFFMCHSEDIGDFALQFEDGNNLRFFGMGIVPHHLGYFLESTPDFGGVVDIYGLKLWGNPTGGLPAIGGGNVNIYPLNTNALTTASMTPSSSNGLLKRLSFAKEIPADTIVTQNGRECWLVDAVAGTTPTVDIRVDWQEFRFGNAQEVEFSFDYLDVSTHLVQVYYDAIGETNNNTLLGQFNMTGTGQWKTWTATISDALFAGRMSRIYWGNDLLIEANTAGAPFYVSGVELTRLGSSAPGNDATYLFDNAPAEVLAGSSFDVLVTMRNTGSTTWTNDVYKLGSVSSPDTTWGGNRVWLDAGTSIAPGASHTFAVSCTAPLTAGDYDFQWQMVEELVEWFGDKIPNKVISVVEEDASVVFVDAPNSVNAGSTFNVSVTMQNTGAIPWTPEAEYKLGSVSSPDTTWGPNRALLDAGTSIAPGASHTFVVSCTAPTTAGDYDFQWQMLEEYVAWFGAKTPNEVISVVDYHDAAVVSVDAPGSVNAGSSFNVSVTMQNTGSIPWTPEAKYKLGSVSSPDTTWGGNRVLFDVGTSIAPGASHTFVVACTAPLTAGDYDFQWQMVEELVEWFGAKTPNEVISVIDYHDAMLVSVDAPGSVNTGSTFNVSVTMQNTGSIPWTPEAEYKLGSVSSPDNTWGPTRVLLDAGTSIAPGASHTFVVACTAPLTAGDYDFQWQMVEELVEWFGEPTPSQAIVVSAGLNPAIRVTEYYLTTGDFSGTTATVTLDQDLADDYYILVRGSRTGDGESNPNNDYARIISVPGGKGDLADSGASDAIGLQRQTADFDWEGVVTVVECGNAAHPAGFRLVDIVDTSLTGSSGIDTSAAWSDLAQVVLFGGYRGGGVEMFGSPASRKEGTGCYTRLYPSGTNTLNWSRDAGGETMFDAAMTTFVVEWGSEWGVQHVNVSGSNGGNGADATGEYTTAAIGSVARSNSWVWATGTRSDSGIGDCAESCLVTLGDGVNQNASEATVAVGSEYTDAYDLDVYVLTHPDIAVDHRFKADGDSTGLDVGVTVDSATSGARFGWGYNGCNGTDAAFPRPRFWARYTTDSEVTISRGYDGQAFPAWVQGIDLSGLNE